MHVTAIVLVLVLDILVAPLPADAPAPAKVHRIGRRLGVGNPRSGPDASFEAFRQRRRELSSGEGQNRRFEERFLRTGIPSCTSSVQRSSHPWQRRSSKPPGFPVEPLLAFTAPLGVPASQLPALAARHCQGSRPPPRSWPP